jgi:hypothetical protein
MPELPLSGFYRLASLPVSASECVNFRPMIPEATTPTKKALVRTPGLKLATKAGDDDVFNRGRHFFVDAPYFVQGDELYRVDVTYDGFGLPTYSSVLVSGAQLIPGVDPVIMADNGQEGGQMMIVTPDDPIQFNAYIYTVSGGLVQVADADFDGPVSDVNYIDGYFEFTKQNGQKFFISELRDGAAYISTDFTRSEVDPDFNIRSWVLKNQLYIFGSESIQPYQNAPTGAGFPFVYIQGAAQSKGLKSIYAIAQVDDNAIYLGGSVNETPAIWITNGATSEKLSTIPIDQAIATYSAETISGCFAFAYSQAGGRFVVFNFPGEACFIFDFVAKEWFTQESVDSNQQPIPWRVSGVVEAYGVLLVGDSLSNKIGVLDMDTYDEYGEEIRRRFVLPHIDNDGQPFFVDSIELVNQSGIGLTLGQGSDPLVSMSVSRNGGRTFEYGITRSVGAIGDYNYRTIWNQLGRVAREGCFRFDMSDPVDWAITKVEGNFE